MKLILSFSILISMVSCNQDHGITAPRENQQEIANWYDSWIAEEINDGASFHSDLKFNAGEVSLIDIKSDTELIVGLIVKHGFEVSKDAGTIWMGTVSEPRKAAGSPGFKVSFTPVNGEVRLRIENTSSVDTRVALYTKK